MVEARADRRFRHVRDVRRLCARALFHHAENERDALLDRQRVECTVQRVGKLAPLEASVRARLVSAVFLYGKCPCEGGASTRGGAHVSPRQINRNRKKKRP